MFNFITRLFAPKIVYVSQSVLSKPGLKDKPPYGFYRSHYKVLELVSYFTGFGKKVNVDSVLKGIQGLDHRTKEEKRLHDHNFNVRLSELGKMGVLDVEKKQYIYKGIPHYKNEYSLNEKSFSFLKNYFEWYNKK